MSKRLNQSSKTSNKISGRNGFTGELYNLKEEFIPILLKLFPKFEDIILSLIYKVNINLAQAKRNTRKRKL